MRGLLALFELEKALYELRYELDNRPDWVHVPLRGRRCGVLGDATMNDASTCCSSRCACFLRQVGDFLPRLALALLVLIAGWLLAKAVRFAVARGLRAINFNVLTERAGHRRLPARRRHPGRHHRASSALLVYWLVILAALVIGFNSLGLTYVTDLLGRVVLFVPKVMVALLILAFGAYFARFVGNAVTRLLPQRRTCRTPTSSAGSRSTRSSPSWC